MWQMSRTVDVVWIDCIWWHCDIVYHKSSCYYYTWGHFIGLIAMTEFDKWFTFHLVVKKQIFRNLIVIWFCATADPVFIFFFFLFSFGFHKPANFLIRLPYFSLSRCLNLSPWKLIYLHFIRFCRILFIAFDS